MTQLKLKQRIIWGITSIVTLISLLLVTASYNVLETLEDELTDTLVLEQMESIIQRIDRHELSLSPQRLDISKNFIVWIGNPGDIPKNIKELPEGAHHVSTANQTYHAVVSNYHGQTIRVWYDATINENKIRWATFIIFCFAILGIIGSYFLAQWIVHYLMRSMEQVANYIRTWLPSSDRASSIMPSDDQLILQAFNESQQKVNHMLAMEQTTSANINHELRVYLTRIRTDAELAQLDTLSPTERSQYISNIISTIDTIDHSLRSLTRIHGLAEQNEDVYILETLQSLSSILNTKQLALTFKIPDDLSIYLNKYAFLMVARNIIQNVTDHAQATELIISADGTHVRFEDNGQGISDQDLPYVFDQYFQIQRHDTKDEVTVDEINNLGLGLSIVKQLCQLNAWHIEVVSPATDKGGTCFTLRFQLN